MRFAGRGRLLWGTRGAWLGKIDRGGMAGEGRQALEEEMWWKGRWIRELGLHRRLRLEAIELVRLIGSV